MSARLRRPLTLVLLLVGCLLLARLDGAAEDEAPRRFHTTRASEVALDLPAEDESFVFAVFGDRTGGPAEGIAVLRDAVADVNLLDPDLVMTVGDLVQGYNRTPEWLVQAMEFKAVMGGLSAPWFPVAGNHDVYWRGPEGAAPPAGEHDSNYEQHFGPLWYAFRHKDCWFVALFTDEGDPATGRKTFNEPAAQRMSAAQLAFLDETLERARGARHVFLFLHHPRWLKGGYGDDWDRVHARLAAAGNVTAVFAGHIHRMRYDGARDGIEYFTLATVGGAQSGVVPAAGYLHQYSLVTVRDDGIAVTCYPVGGAMDPRAITGEVSDQARAVAEALAPRFEGALALPGAGAGARRVAFSLANPAPRPIEVTARVASADSRWTLAPDHQHARLEPGATARFELELVDQPAALDAAWRRPELELAAEYLAEGWRVPIPARRFGLPLDAAALPAPPAPAVEHVLALDGARGAARVADALLALPDGPFTLETWVRADVYRERQGVVCKTEGSEYGLFANAGAPEFSVHLGGGYVTARAGEALLAPGRWHHLAGVFDGAEVRVYADGRLAARAAGGGARRRNALPLLVGADVDGRGGATSTLQGELDEVRLSVGVRYAGERFTPARRFEADGDTLLLLHCDAAQGPWLYDASGAARHAELDAGARVAPAAAD